MVEIEESPPAIRRNGRPAAVARRATRRVANRQMPQACPPQRGIGKRATKDNARSASLAVVMTGAPPSHPPAQPSACLRMASRLAEKKGMRALSIRQPYAELILRGTCGEQIKPIEFRSRPTKIIGERIYMYASQQWAEGKLFLEGCRVKPEIRNPKSESNPNSEIRMTKPVIVGDNIEVPGSGPQPVWFTPF